LLYLIGGASFNIKRNLGYYNSRGKDLEDEILRIKRLRIEIDKCKDVMELMGIEGNIRKIYYSGWNKIVNQEYIPFEMWW
jgi:CRISPR-associated protein Cas1